MGVITHPLMPAVRCTSVQLCWMGVRSWVGRMRRWYRRARCAGRSGGHYHRVFLRLDQGFCRFSAFDQGSKVVPAAHLGGRVVSYFWRT